MKTSALAPLIFRIAAWPADAVEPLRSASFASAVDRALATQDAIRARGDELSALLYAEVPRLDAEQRRIALRLRRALHRNTDPVNASDLQALRLSSVLEASLLSDDVERHCLQEHFKALRIRYDATLQCELKELSRIAGEAKFRRALIVASPGTSNAWEQVLQKGGIPDSWRLRTTLLQYLMRAAGRATPNGLWAGVAMEAPYHAKEPIAIRPAPFRVFVKPDLNVFFELFTAAASALHYRRSVYLRWNPTLTEFGEGEYAWAHLQEDTWVMERTSNDPDIASLQAVFGHSEHASFDELLNRSQLAEQTLHRLYDTGVLCAQCDREGVYENPCAALQALLPCLVPEEQPVWSAAITELFEICGELEKPDGELEIGHLRIGIARARQVVNLLRARYDLEPYSGDRGVLCFDHLAPFEISVSEELRHGIADAVRKYWHFDRGGTGELLSRRARAAHASCEAADGALALAGISVERAENTTDPNIEEQYGILLDEWTRDLEPSASASVHEVGLAYPEVVSPMGPGAALVVPGITPQGLSFRIGSIGPDSGVFYGRFHHLFAATGKRSFCNWMAQSKALAETQGVLLADIAVRGAYDRNTALRPRIGNRILDPLSAESTGIVVRFEGECRAVLRDHDGRRVFPVLHSAVETSSADPWSQWLAAVEANAGRPSLRVPQPPLARELDTWKHCPRLTLGPTTVIAPERWGCPAETMELLCRTNGFDRFVAWRKWVRQAGIPDRTYAQYGTTGTETLLLSDSLLAVEVLGRGLSQTDSPLRLQEMFFGEKGLWLRDDQGRKYMAEIALAWPADKDFWRC
ncbi:MAG TPA: lantibiotic dehydratase [Bryobacteraceae bacterium]|nr:lantibiotic dehydratase [Bryobacteraceae bacterium]